MARINPKLNLNKTPQNVENSSLVFAKNIKLLPDLSIAPDSSINKIQHWFGENQLNPKIVGKIVGINNKIYFFTEEIIESQLTPSEPESEYEEEILYNIYEYDELTNNTIPINSAWTYSGGQITGCVTSNNTNESILTICEYFDTEEDNKENSVPIKHINLNRCSNLDDESTYTQHPNIPITNLKLLGKYTKAIPSGVYQFFIRYRIRKGFYTNWMVCSPELYTAKQEYTTTIQGSLKYVNLKLDSNESFILYVEHLYGAYLSNYEGFELGFTLSHEGATVARKWKFFNTEDNITEIYFDYLKEDIEDINIDDLFSTNYELFNIKNLVFYKNKLYVSNYKETDFNSADDSFKTFAEGINITLDIKQAPQEEYDSVVYLGDYELHKTQINGIYYYDQYYKDDEWHFINDISYNEDHNNVSIEVLNERNTFEFNHIYNDSGESVPPSAHDLNPPEYLNKQVLQYVAFVYNDGTSDTIIGNLNYENQSTYPTNPIVFDDTTRLKTIKNRVIELISTYPFFIKDNKYFVRINQNQPPKELKNIQFSIGYIKYIRYEINVTGTSGGEITYYNYNLLFFYKKISSRANITTQLISPIDYKQVIGKNIEYNTLLPFTTYDFYCHFIKQNGVISNGYKIATKTIKRFAKYEEIGEGTQSPQVLELPSITSTLLSVNAIDDDNGVTFYTNEIGSDIPTFKQYRLTKLSDDTIIYPKFTPTRMIPDGYVGYFISVYKHNNQVSQGFDFEQINQLGRLDCIECDTMLYNVNDNITILNALGETVTTSASYADSGDTRNNLRDFGSTGYIFFDITQENQSALAERKQKLFIVDNQSESNIDVKNLVKITPYIKGVNNILSYKDIYATGYLVAVSKLNKKLSNNTNTNYYVSGSDVYNKEWDSQTNRLELTENDSLVNGIPNVPEVYIVHSNYNLHYVSLSEDIVPQIRRFDVENKVYNRTSEGDTYTEEVETSKKQIIKAVNSLTASYILTFDKTFKEYRIPYYQKVEEDKPTIFNNTVRSSDVNVDEVYRNIYRFKPTDYYNVPTNRGVIINMFNIVNKIYVHTEHGLFVFTDNNMLKVGDNLYTSNDKISLNETEPFNVGVQEIFDSEFGYGGIQNKHHSLVTFNSYIFYDKIADTIYAYSGDTNLVPISDSIYKILKWFKPDDIYFANDNTNNRFFMNLVRVKNNVRENICISYSFVSKSFVSIHDLDYDESFNSRINTYFVKQYINTNDNEEETIQHKVFVIDKNLNHYNDYNELKKISLLTLNDCDSIYENSNIVANSFDIIANTEYEKVKALNFINWICSAITDYYTDGDINLAEETKEKYSGFKIRIYSDQTYTPLQSLTDNENNALISNDVHLMQSNILISNAAFENPRYNCGVWSMNYFRDVMNIDNTKPIDSDNKSLLYGKYFVVRFVLKDKNFKFENIKINMNDYEKA